MIKTKRVKYIACDICGEEIEDARVMAPVAYTCCQCGKQVCDEHRRDFRCDYDGEILRLCTECMEKLNVIKRKTLSDLDDVTEV